ncbi:MAG: undecaprenyl-phosphate glucose phosphotransferase [Burkholderiaceae bacterium]
MVDKDANRGFAVGARPVFDVVKAATDPLLAVLTLLAATVLHGQPIRGAEIILSLLTFSLCYPGTIQFRHRQLGLLRALAASWAVVAALLVGLGYVTGTMNQFQGDVIVAWILATPVMQFIVHWLSPSVVPKMLALNRKQRAIVIGANKASRQLSSTFNDDPFSNTRVVAFFDDRNSQRLGPVPEGPILGRVADAVDYVRSQDVHSIYIALPMAKQPRIMQLLDGLRDTTVSIFFVPDIFMVDLIQARLDAVGGVPIVAVCDSPFEGVTGLTKRLSDIIIALLAIVATAPLMLAIAAAVKFTSPGPVIFRQKRYGLDGKEINVWKFRSMTTTDNGETVRQATVNDPRITKVGHFLCRTSLDELPQFFNVLEGRMSVVGPRPHAVAHNETFRKVIKGYMVRHKVKPGITGWAQVNGARGETPQLADMERRVALDLEYLRSWSLRLDLYIIWRTVALVFTGDPKAY